MPYAMQKKGAFIIERTDLDLRRKLDDDDKDRIKRLHDNGMSLRELARTYKVSRRLIQFTVFPERKVIDLENRRLRGGSKHYYTKEKHRAYTKKHRRRKQALYLSTKKEGGQK